METPIKRIFVNSFHSIAVSVAIVGILSFFILKHFNISLSKDSLSWCLTFITAPIAILFQSMNALNSTGEIKDITGSESRRLDFILNTRSKMTRNSMLFYIALAFICGFLLWLKVDSKISFSLILGLLVTSVLSIAGAIQDNIETSQFKRRIQARTNAKTESDRIMKKLKDPK
ncbi:hypothetical protein [Acinetobacter rathckeae]|uniref:hypothetical protein n=1 Tax=Acinetobacter rathckeae TaxID=2605272 RepID=UPI0018A260F7|nr:hypothetical protein [Acinetobacter rathckeae]MBF7696649.1 hypothetical protein [Acinetobacter rathckeae]